MPPKTKAPSSNNSDREANRNGRDSPPSKKPRLSPTATPEGQRAIDDNNAANGYKLHTVYIISDDCDAPELRRQVVTLGCQVVYVDYENPGFIFVAPVAVGYPLEDAVRAGHIRVTVTRLPGGLDLTEFPDLR